MPHYFSNEHNTYCLICFLCFSAFFIIIIITYSLFTSFWHWKWYFHYIKYALANQWHIPSKRIEALINENLDRGGKCILQTTGFNSVASEISFNEDGPKFFFFQVTLPKTIFLKSNKGTITQNPDDNWHGCAKKKKFLSYFLLRVAFHGRDDNNIYLINVHQKCIGKIVEFCIFCQKKDYGCM